MAEVRALAGGVLVEVDPETLLRAVVVVDPLETRLTVLEGDEELPLGREEGEGLVPTEGREPTEGRADDPSAVDYGRLEMDEPRQREKEIEVSGKKRDARNRANIIIVHRSLSLPIFYLLTFFTLVEEVLAPAPEEAELAPALAKALFFLISLCNSFSISSKAMTSISSFCNSSLSLFNLWDS